MKILIIKIGALGDVLRITPIIHTLADNNFKIDILTSATGKEVLKNNPFINNIFVLKLKRNPFELLSLKNKLSKFSYKYIISLETFKPIQIFKKLNPNIYIDYKNIKPEYNKLNVIELFYEYIKPIVGDTFIRYNNEIYPSEQDRSFVDSFLKKFSGFKYSAAIHAGTSKTDRLLTKNLSDVRLWPVQNYIELTRKLLKKEFIVFFTGSKNESSINKNIISETGHDKAINTAGLFNIQQLQYFINRMNWFISVDSGIAHVASSTKVKQITLCGPTDGKVSAPIPGKDYYCIQKNPEDCPPCYDEKHRRKKCQDNKCMKNIEVDDIYRIIKQ